MPTLPKAHGQSGQPLQIIVKDGFLVRPSVPVDILEYNDPVTQFQVEVSPRFGIGVALRHPEAVTVVKGHGDGLANHRFAGKAVDLEAVGQAHPFDRFFGGGEREVRFLGVGRLGEVAEENALSDQGNQEKGAREFSFDHVRRGWIE